MDESSVVNVSEGDTPAATAPAANVAAEVVIDGPTNLESDSDSINFEALYDANRGASELPGLRGLSIVGSSSVIDLNNRSTSEPDQESINDNSSILVVSEERALDPGALERNHGVSEIQDQSQQAQFEAEHQRRLAEPDQDISDVVEASFGDNSDVSGTPSLTDSSLMSIKSSELERELLSAASLPQHRGSYNSQQNMEDTGVVGNNNDTDVGDRTQQEAVPEMTEARLDGPRRYSMEELLQLRHVGNRPLHQLNFRSNAPVDLIARHLILPDHTAANMLVQAQYLEAKAREPWMSDDDEEVFQGGAAVTSTKRSSSVPEVPEVREIIWPIRQPVNPPESLARQILEGFARFLKDHTSPNHSRVTAGGRVVPAGPNSPPPTFNIGYIDGVLQRFDRIHEVRKALDKQARDAEGQERQKAIDKAGASGGDAGPTPTPTHSAGDTNPTNNVTANGVALNDQLNQKQVAPSGTLTLPPRSQPLFMAEDGTTIFHMGGSMFRAVLRDSQTVYELLIPVQPVGNMSNGEEISQPMSQSTIMAMPPMAPISVAQPSMQPSFTTQTTNPVHGMDFVQATPQMTAMPQFVNAPTPTAIGPIFPSEMVAMTQSVASGRGYGENIHRGAYFPVGNSSVQDSRRHAGHEAAPMAVQLYNPDAAEYSNPQPSRYVQLQNVESRMKSLLKTKSELEQQWALQELQMSPEEKIWNRDQLRECTVQCDELRRMKKSFESSINTNSNGRSDLTSSGNSMSTMSRPALQAYEYNGLDGTRASFASMIPNDTYNGGSRNIQQSTEGHKRLEHSVLSQSFSGNPENGIAYSTNAGTNSKTLSPSAPSFVPGSMDVSTPQKPRRGHQSSVANRDKSCEVSSFKSHGTTQAAMSGRDWAAVINLNHPAGEIDDADMWYCEEAGFNDPTKPKKYCTTALEVAWVVKNVRQQAKLLGCKNGSSKDPEWDAEQDIRHAIFVLRRPIPLAPMLPEFVRRMCPWSWEDSIFNIGQGMSPYWVAEQHHRAMGAGQREAQVDLWSHERLLLLQEKLARDQEIANANKFFLKDLARRELSFTASSRKRSESIVSWDSDMARAADKALASAKKITLQNLKPLSELKATPSQNFEDSVFDNQSYRRHGQSNTVQLTSGYSVDNNLQEAASGSSYRRRQANHSGENSSFNDSFCNNQVMTVPVDSPTSDKKSKTFLRNMLDLKVTDWEPLPGETQEEFNEAYSAGKRISGMANSGSGQKSSLEFQPTRHTTTKENRPFQDRQFRSKPNEVSSSPSESVPHLRRMGHKARSSMASPIFNAQGIVPPVTGISSVSPCLSSSNPGLQRQQEHATSFRNNHSRRFAESSNTHQPAFTESSGPRNWQTPSLTGRHTRTRPGDYSSQYRSTEDTLVSPRSQNAFGYGNSYYHQPPHSRRG
ncbi:hypothetical protein MMC26_005703 [Xylographa opegraphella]|nr:hypothetical protein [Xylographa opegraphella]